MSQALTYKPNDYIWIICKKAVYIRQLRRSGPIIAPLKVKMATAYSIICSGIELIQYCPITHEYATMNVRNAFRVDKFPKYYAMLTASKGQKTAESDASVEAAENAPTASTMTLRSASPVSEETSVPAEQSVVQTTEAPVEPSNENPEAEAPVTEAPVEPEAQNETVTPVESSEDESTTTPSEAPVEPSNENPEAEAPVEPEAQNAEDNEEEEDDEEEGDLKDPAAPSTSSKKRKRKNNK